MIDYASVLTFKSKICLKMELQSVTFIWVFNLIKIACLMTSFNCIFLPTYQALFNNRIN